MKLKTEEVKLFSSVQLQISLLNQYLNSSKAEIVCMPKDFHEVITRRCPDFRLENEEKIRPYWEKYKVDTHYTYLDINYIEEDLVKRLEHDLEITIKNISNYFSEKLQSSPTYFLTIILPDEGLFSSYIDEVDTFHIVGSISYCMTYRHFITQPEYLLPKP